MSDSRVSVGWLLRGRLLVLWGVVLAMMSPLMAVSSAQAAVASTVSLSVSPSVATAGESIVLSGEASPSAAGRTVWLQRYGTAWSTVASVVTSSTGRYSGSVSAGVVGSHASWRAVARPTATAAQTVSATRNVAVVKATLSCSGPLLAEVNNGFTVSGAGYPARAGRVVVVQRLSGSSWTEVARTTQSVTGGYSVQTRMGSAGNFTYRAVTLSWHGSAAVTSATNVVGVQAASLVLTESTAIATETVQAAGQLPGVLSRPILVQRKSGVVWVMLAQTTTSSTGSYVTSFDAPRVGTYTLRVLAPKVTLPKRVQAEYVSATKTLSVVAQSASVSMPTTGVQSQTGTATVKFGPVRVGRAVALQVMRSGAWTTIATGEQSRTGRASLPYTAGTPGSYSYRGWTAAANGAPTFTSPAAVLEVTATLGPVTSVTAIPASDSVALSWTNPSDPSLTGVMIRRAEGATPPASAAEGTQVTDAARPAESFTDTTVTSGTQYSYSLFAHDAALGVATAGTVTTTTITAGALPSITGTVTDAGPVRRGLANVRVSVNSPATDTATFVMTAGDGSYAVSGLAPGTDYQVWFYPSGATGGSSDALGYLDQAYDNQQPMFGDTPTPVTVTAGATTTGVDAALAVGGAITGTVRDAEGNALIDVSVSVSSPSNGNYQGYAKTTLDGGYAVQGMPAGNDYQVCFLATGAKGGSTDALGYLDQCFDNQSTMGTPTPVAVTLGQARVGVDANLPVAGGVSGTVTDASGTKHGLAGVSVQVYSPSNFGYANATTAADGTYTAAGLAAGTDYQVCFYSSGATGGSTDATGYLDQCYDNQPTSGTPTPVTVVLGAAGAGTNAALTGGGAISGMVSDGAGSHHGLANVWVSVSSSSTGTSVNATTAADGAFAVSGLAAGSDYAVCVSGSGATGGSADALGYVDQCYDNQPTWETATPVVVTLGATAVAVNAALAAAGGISGTVREASTQQGLANVLVQVLSPSYGINGGYAVTAPDGTYTVTGLAPGPGYQVSFSAAGATGGSSDALGYVDQFYDNQPTWETAVPVTVAAGETRTGVDAALGSSAP